MKYENFFFGADIIKFEKFIKQLNLSVKQNKNIQIGKKNLSHKIYTK